MRLPTLLLSMLLGACASSLQQGDRALAEARWSDASAAYAKADVAEDATLFRRAVLLLSPEGTLHDADAGRALLSELGARSTRSPYTLAARLLLASLERETQLAARIAELDREIARTAEELALTERELERERDESTAEVAALDESRRELSAALELLRAERSELLALKDQADRLREEMEAIKSIDLGD